MKKAALGLLGATALYAISMITTAPPATAGSVSFTISLGDVGMAYSDGYYDQNRRWHRWRNHRERDWYRHNHRDSYFSMTHTRDRDSNHGDWRRGKRNDWHSDDGDHH